MLTGRLPGRDPKTVAKNKYVLEPVLAVIGNVRMRELDVTDVDKAPAAVAATRSSATVAMAHVALTRAITRAQAKSLVLRNMSALTGTPPGLAGRPSRSMTLAQATAATAAAKAAGPRTWAYVMLSLCTRGPDRGSTRTAVAARRLRRPRQRAAAASQRGGVWRSVRARADTKTRKSRRTLGLPHLAVTALQVLHDKSRPEPGDLKFSTATGQALDAAGVCRSFRAVCTTAGIGPEWTPRELRHTFVSLMSDCDIAVQEIARLVGHASSKVTESVYRHQLRPVMTTAPLAPSASISRWCAAVIAELGYCGSQRDLAWIADLVLASAGSCHESAVGAASIWDLSSWAEQGVVVRLQLVHVDVRKQLDRLNLGGVGSVVFDCYEVTEPEALLESFTAQLAAS